jgi:peptide/nickel transport system permease protein
VQYARLLGGLVRGDLGSSYQTHGLAHPIIAEQAGPTLALALSALALAWAIALLLTVPNDGRDGPLAPLVLGFQVAAAVAPP